MDEVGSRSAIVVPIALPAALETIRQQHVDNARLGVPAHVTLLFPFVPPPVLQPADVERAAAAVARTGTFIVQFKELTAFDATPTNEAVVWLAPEPAAPFIAMTEALVGAFPGYLPYGGLHDTVIPHLTLGNNRIERGAIEAEASHAIPFRRRVRSAVVLTEGEAGRWRTAHHLRLG